MSEEIIKVIKIETDASITSVKDLRKYISDLRDSLVTLDKESEEYSQTVEELTKQQKKLTEVQSAGKSTYSELDDSIKGLRLQLKSLNNTYDELSAADRNSEVGKNLLAKIQSIDAELKELENSTGRHQRSVGNYQLALEALNKTYASERQELKALKVAMESLTPGTEEYTKAFNRAAEITHNLQEQQEKLRYASPDLGDQLSNIRGIATSMVAGFSAVNAAMGLFGEKNEDVQKAMLKVQQAMAIVQGLQGMDGLLKRTEGLSTAMKTWFNTSKQVTTQTIAQTTAVQGETVATNTATVAQKGLNAAMKANPIGVIITAVMALVTVWTMFGKKITELIKGNEKLNNILTKTKAVLATIGETIKQAVLVPLKEVINYVKTIGTVMVDVFTGQWGKIGDDIKEGLGNAVDIVKDAGTKIGTAYNNSLQKQMEEGERERNRQRVKELEEVIKNNDAKYDSDWKYTESGKTIYEEYLQAKINSYEKDSDEYKEAVREKMSYDRDYNKFVDKQNQEQAKKAKESAEKRKKALEDAVKQQEQIESKYQSLIQKTVGSSVRENRKTFQDQLNALYDYYVGVYNNMLKENDKFAPAVKGQLEIIKGYLKDFENETKSLEMQAFNLFNTGEKEPDFPEGFLNWKKMKTEFDKIWQLYQATINDSIKNSQEENARKFNDSIIQLYEKNIIPNFSKENEKLKANLEEQLTDLNFSIDIFGGKDKEEERANLIYQSTVQQLTNVLDHYQKIKDFVENNNLTPSDEYEEALSIIQTTSLQIEQAGIKLTQDLREINNKYFNQSLADTEAYTGELIRMTENIHQYNTDLNFKYTEEGKEIYSKYFDSLIDFYEKDSEDYKKALEQKEAYDAEFKNHSEKQESGGFDLSNLKNEYLKIWDLLGGADPAKEQQIMDEVYNIELAGLEKIKALWEQRKADETLSYEERVQAAQSYAETISQIDDLQLEHQIETNEQKKNLIQSWVDQMSTALNTIGQLFNTLANSYKDDIDAQKKANKISNAEAEKQYNQKVKPLMIAEATISTLQGMVSAFSGAMQLGPIAGPIVGGILAGLVGTMGAINIAKISSTNPYSNSGSGGASFEPPSADYNFTPEYTQNVTGAQDVEYLRNSISEQPIKAYVVESEISSVQELSNTRNNESTF